MSQFDLSAVKNLHLRPNGSNYSSYAFKMRNIFKVKKLLPALTIKESSDDDADVIDVLKQRLLLQAISKLSRGEVEDRIPLPRTLAAQEEHRAMMDKALTYITTTR